jgi:para-aminobenzoate synthetase component 1
LPNLSLDDLELPDFYMAFPNEIIVKDELNNIFYYCGNSKREWKEGTGKEINIKFNEIEKGNEEFYNKNIDKERFYEIVEIAKKYIKEGDIFQVNLSQRFSAEFKRKNGLELYKILRKINPSPFASYVNIEDFSIISQSPERLISLDSNRIAQSRPIAGTRRFKKENEIEMQEENVRGKKWVRQYDESLGEIIDFMVSPIKNTVTAIVKQGQNANEIKAEIEKIDITKFQKKLTKTGKISETAVREAVRKRFEKLPIFNTKNIKGNIADRIEDAAVESIMKKITEAMDIYTALTVQQMIS